MVSIISLLACICKIFHEISSKIWRLIEIKRTPGFAIPKNMIKLVSHLLLVVKLLDIWDFYIPVVFIWDCPQSDHQSDTWPLLCFWKRYIHALEHGKLQNLSTNPRFYELVPSQWCLSDIYIHRQTSNIRHIFGGNIIFDQSDVVGASRVGAAPTTSSFSK